MAFKNNQVSDTGYYVTYLLLFGLLISAFISTSLIATNVIGQILDFMKALVPSYFMSVAFALVVCLLLSSIRRLNYNFPGGFYHNKASNTFN